MLRDVPISSKDLHVIIRIFYIMISRIKKLDNNTAETKWEKSFVAKLAI